MIGELANVAFGWISSLFCDLEVLGSYSGPVTGLWFSFVAPTNTAVSLWQIFPNSVFTNVPVFRHRVNVRVKAACLHALMAYRGCSWVEGRGEWCGRPWQQNVRGSRTDALIEDRQECLRSTTFNLLRPITENEINNFDIRSL